MSDIDIRQQLSEINTDMSGLIARANRQIPAAAEGAFPDWQRTCEICEKRLEDDLLRMAVVGTIKSGKSTFINSLFGGDYLKRGAGVITSIVTRVRRSERLRAVLYFKSWDEINREIDQALAIFPSTAWRSGEEAFDIRKQSDRTELAEALDALEARHFLTKDSRNVNSVLLAAYLKGYDAVKEIVSDSTEILPYESDRFSEHQAYVSEESLAVYLKDIALEIDSGEMASNIEIADCQGSDSPNPLHLAMIQDYLRTADLVVYLISSRTGLRQADIRFLRMIESMVGMSHVLFVVNSDFNEHASTADLQRVTRSIVEDLALITPSPAIYVFSALYNLFAAQDSNLAEKEHMQLEQWKADADLVSFSDSEKQRFYSDFRKLITEQRYSLLLQNQLQRIHILVRDFRNWLSMSRDFLSANAEDAKDLVKKIKQQQKKTERVKSMIQSTLDGAVGQLKRETKSEVDRFFDHRHGAVVPGVIEFVQNYAVSYESYRKMLAENGFSDTLFAIFQAFKQDLDRYMAETVNPALFGFIKNKEGDIKAYFESITRPYEAMVNEALTEFHNAVADDDQGTAAASAAATGAIELESVKQNMGLALPSASMTLAYSRGLKTEAFMKLGFYRVVNTVKKLTRRKTSESDADLPALQSGVRRMKKETEATLVFHFKNYRENIKFQYLFPLIEGVSGEMLTRLVDRFAGYHTDLSKLKAMADQSQESKNHALAAIDDIVEHLAAIRKRMDGLQQELSDFS